MHVYDTTYMLTYCHVWLGLQGSWRSLEHSRNVRIFLSPLLQQRLGVVLVHHPHPPRFPCTCAGGHFGQAHGDAGLDSQMPVLFRFARRELSG